MTEVDTPQRRASNHLLQQGQIASNQGRYDQAADLFQEAISVDSSNGAAYYEMAQVRTHSGEYGDAWGFVEKAEALLGDSPEWAERLEKLKQDIKNANP